MHELIRYGRQAFRNIVNYRCKYTAMVQDVYLVCTAVKLARKANKSIDEALKEAYRLKRKLRKHLRLLAEKEHYLEIMAGMLGLKSTDQVKELL